MPVNFIGNTDNMFRKDSCHVDQIAFLTQRVKKALKWPSPLRYRAYEHNNS